MSYKVNKKNAKFGCIDENDNYIILPEYEKLKISFNCCICWKSDKVYIYDFGKKAFIIVCDKVREDKDGYFAFSRDNLWGVFCSKEKGFDKIIINASYEDVCQLHSNLYSVKSEKGYFIANSPDEYARYNDAHPTFYRWDRILAKRDGKFGFINEFNLTTIPFIYDEIKEKNIEGQFDIRIGNMWGILALDGREIISPKYSHVVFPSDSDCPNYYYFYIINEIDELWGTIRKKVQSCHEECVWKNKFNIVEDARSGLHGVVNREGKEIVPCIYEFVNIIFKENIGKYRKYFTSQNLPFKKNTEIVFFEVATERFSFCDCTTIMNYGLYDTKGNNVVPVEYEQYDLMDDGYIFTHEGRDYHIYNINPSLNHHISGIDRLIFQESSGRFFLFTTKESKKDDRNEFDELDYCVPLDKSFKTLLKDKEGNYFHLKNSIYFQEIPEDYKLSIGGLETYNDSYSSISALNGDCILYKKGDKFGIFYLKTLNYSSLYDNIDYVRSSNFLDNIFSFKVGNSIGIYYEGKEVLKPIFFKISFIVDGYCFVIKENYSRFDIDFINIVDVENFHYSALKNLTRNDVDNIIDNNYLFFDVKDNSILFNSECPYKLEDDFVEIISKKRISLKEKYNARKMF